MSVFSLCPSALGQVNIIGYVSGIYVAGTNLVANPVENGTDTLNSLFPDPPEGTTISFWDPATQAFSSRSAFTTGPGWFPDLVLPSGEGALLFAPQAFTNTFAGNLLEPDGSPLEDSGPLRLPSPDRPTGTYLLSSKTPASLGSQSLPVFPLVLGRGPQEGEEFTWFDALNQTYHSTTFSSGTWDNGGPVLPICTSAFFRIYASPTLQATSSGHELVVSWAASAPDFQLEVCTNLSAVAVWTSVTNGVVTNATGFVFTNTNPSSSVFYRLRKR